MSGATATAHLLLTGDELLRGFVQEANAIVVAASLRDLGVTLSSIRVVGDAPGALRSALAEAHAADVSLVVVTGGLGPTHDDRTSELVAEIVGRPLELRSDALEIVEARVRAYGRMRTPEEVATFAPGNEKQATLPAGATMLDPLGTAPGYVLASTAAPTFVVLPGPPSEMRHAWQQALRSAEVRAVTDQVVAAHERLVRAWGVPESRASQVLAGLAHEDSPGCQVTLCARDGELELSIRGTDAQRIDDLAGGLRGALGANVFAVDDERTIARIVGDALRERGWTLATAESCTGGLVAAALTDVPGSSAWFPGGAVSYANDVKRSLLQVDAGSLAREGAVSEAVAREMAAGARATFAADVAVAVTGIAGPGGGSDDKPVGTVHLVAAGPDGDLHRRVRIPGDRSTVRRRSVAMALHLVRELLDA